MRMQFAWLTTSSVSTHPTSDSIVITMLINGQQQNTPMLLLDQTASLTRLAFFLHISHFQMSRAQYMVPLHLSLVDEIDYYSNSTGLLSKPVSRSMQAWTSFISAVSLVVWT